jgi:hypothetical protein
MKPDLVIVPSEKELDMRAHIEEIRNRANPCGDLGEYWNALKCQYDREYLLKCVEALLRAKD